MEPAKLIFIVTTVIGLILAAAILPRIVEFVNQQEPHFVISGFQDMQRAEAADAAPAIPTLQPMDREPSPLSRKAMCGNQVCPEGSFCDDLTQTCTSVYPSSSTPDEGYYA